MPLVSIITPTYNTEQYIGHTIRSIMAQTMEDWELILVDDASTDGTVKEILKIDDKRIRLIVLEKNSGTAFARNKAIEMAQGRYIALCDSDDFWAPDKLEKQIAFMNEKECGLSYTGYFRCKEDGTPYRAVKCRRKTSYRDIRRYNSIPCLTAMYDTALTGKVFVPLLRKRQDWALWIKVLQKCGRSYGLNEPLAYYRVRENSLSSNTKTSIEYNIKVLTDVLGYGKVRAWLHYWLLTMPRKL